MFLLRSLAERVVAPRLPLAVSMPPIAADCARRQREMVTGTASAACMAAEPTGSWGPVALPLAARKELGVSCVNQVQRLAGDRFCSPRAGSQAANAAEMCVGFQVHRRPSAARRP